MGWGVIAIGSGLLCVSARCRMRNNYYRYTGEGAISTPFAEALGQVVGMAGGIYLSLVLLCNFLDMDLPEKTVLLGRNVDFLALVALLLACAQPMILWGIGRKK